MITAANSSAEGLKAILDAAFVDSEVSQDHLVATGFPVTIIVTDRDFLRLMTFLEVRDGVPRLALLEIANAIAGKLPIPRAKVEGEAEAMGFDLAVPFGEGLTPRYFVQCIQLFRESIKVLAPFIEDVVK